MSEISILRQRAGLSVEELAKLSGFDVRTAYRWESGEKLPRPAVIEMLKAKIENKGRHTEDSKFTFIDLFAGIGGLRKGFESIGGSCVFTSEWDLNCQKTYRANFPHDSHEVAGDITKIEESSIPIHDVLLAGFPCQPFSLAGVSKKNSLNRAHGFEDKTQGTLFFDVARIIAHHKPKAFLLENVKNLKSHDGGNTFRTIMDVLTKDLGYQVSYRIIDAKSFVPQHRERIFIVGFLDKNEFDINQMSVPDPAQGPKLKTILHPENNTEEFEDPYTLPDGKIGDKYTLTPRLWDYLQKYSEKHRLKGNGFGFGLFGPEDTSRTLSARYYKDGSEILIKQEGKRPRRLTPRECARLMGFEKAGGTRFRIPVSDMQAYKQFGNAVVVPVIEAIAEYMEPAILKAVNKLVPFPVNLGKGKVSRKYG